LEITSLALAFFLGWVLAEIYVLYFVGDHTSPS